MTKLQTIILALACVGSVFISLLIKKGQSNAESNLHPLGNLGSGPERGVDVLEGLPGEEHKTENLYQPILRSLLDPQNQSGIRRPLQKRHSGRGGGYGTAPACPLIERAMMLILWRESRCGGDPECGPGWIGPKGERGPWQVTKIFIRDCKRLFGCEQVFGPMPHVDDLVGWTPFVREWLTYYGGGCKTIYDLRELYRRGPTGFREWKGTSK